MEKVNIDTLAYISVAMAQCPVRRASNRLDKPGCHDGQGVVSNYRNGKQWPLPPIVACILRARVRLYNVPASSSPKDYLTTFKNSHARTIEATGNFLGNDDLAALSDVTDRQGRNLHGT